jgi:hypothetical protein
MQARSFFSAGEVPLAWQHVALPRLVEEVLRMVGALARSREVRVVQEIGRLDCEVHGDLVRPAL